MRMVVCVTRSLWVNAILSFVLFLYSIIVSLIAANCENGLTTSQRCHNYLRTYNFPCAVFLVQQLGQPEIFKVSLTSCPVVGGMDLFIVGRNFAKTATVQFKELNKGIVACGFDAETNLVGLHNSGD